MSREKLLIIKPGYSETLDPEVSGTVSLGDVFRSTVLLHAFPRARYEVTWVTDPLAWPLLRGNALIDRVIKINAFTPFHLQRDYFDVVVNLEKDPGICALADSIPGWRKYGFRYDPRSSSIAGHREFEQAFNIAKDPHLKQRVGRNWSELLFEMVGERWQGENYVLGHRSEVPITHDVGFNYRVGSKFPHKSWPMEHWQGLEARCTGAGLSVAWQLNKTMWRRSNAISTGSPPAACSSPMIRWACISPSRWTNRSSPCSAPHPTLTSPAIRA